MRFVMEFHFMPSLKTSLSCSPCAFESIRSLGRQVSYIVCTNVCGSCYSQFELKLLPSSGSSRAMRLGGVVRLKSPRLPWGAEEPLGENSSERGGNQTEQVCAEKRHDLKQAEFGGCHSAWGSTPYIHV